MQCNAMQCMHVCMYVCMYVSIYNHISTITYISTTCRDITTQQDWPLLRVAPCLAADLGVVAPARVHGSDDTEVESLGIVIASFSFLLYVSLLEFIIKTISLYMSRIEVQTRLRFFWSAEAVGLGIKKSGVWGLPFMSRSGNVLQLLHSIAQPSQDLVLKMKIRKIHYKFSDVLELFRAWMWENKECEA